MSEETRATVGARWRVLAHEASGPVELENRGVLDELVVDDWLHLEQMSESTYWMRLGDARLLVEVRPDGSVRVDVERGEYAPPVGTTRA